MQSLLNLIYPHQCAMCGTLVEGPGALCGSCWRDTPFIRGLVCDLCGAPLPGEDPGHGVHCDDCMSIARPWSRGRAAFLYRDRARRMVLSLKHADRLDLVRPAGRWLASAAAPVLHEGQAIVPVPIHWTRRLRRRYNQAALLALALARVTGATPRPQALMRVRRTPVQDGMTVGQRFANQADVIRPHPRHGTTLDGADVLLVDDVMTSGATLAAATEACRAAGASSVSVATLARVVKDA